MREFGSLGMQKQLGRVDVWAKHDDSSETWWIFYLEKWKLLILMSQILSPSWLRVASVASPIGGTRSPCYFGHSDDPSPRLCREMESQGVKRSRRGWCSWFSHSNSWYIWYRLWWFSCTILFGHMCQSPWPIDWMPCFQGIIAKDCSL